MTKAYSLKEVQARFGVPQHTLIHLCEKGVVIPDVSDTQGRGRWREFSPKNLFEFAVALEIRKYDIPVAKTGAIIRILGAFEKAMKKRVTNFAIPDSLEQGPEVKFYLFDGNLGVFSLGGKSFLSFDLERLLKGDVKRVQPSKLTKLPSNYNSHLEVDFSLLSKRL